MLREVYIESVDSASPLDLGKMTLSHAQFLILHARTSKTELGTAEGKRGLAMTEQITVSQTLH
jgi:hypothetical protein